MSLRKGSRGVWRKIDGFIKDMERELRKRDYDEYLVLNDQFHTFFYELTENEWAIKISQMLRKQATMLRSLSLYTRNRFSASIVEHRTIAEAYKSGDSGQLTKAVENHLLRFKENIIQS
ncbi:MAG: FCD domain-containing protein, partial [Deltaproteobacteria bacterium]|nr:FCD domain-containing protein [Deltaproteobacteria bacterium]